MSSTSTTSEPSAAEKEMIFPGRFAGKAVVVTGAAQGIGRTVARRIAGEGSKLALVDRAPLVEEVRHEAEAADAEAIAVIADLETFAGAIAAINGAQEHFDHIDILINNVGGTIWAKPYAEYEEAEIVAEIRRSLFPTLWCCRAVLPGMLERGEGRRQCHHGLSCHGIRGARRPGLRRSARRHRSPAAAHPAQRRGAERSREGMAPPGRRPDDLVEPDETLRHDRGAGGGDLVSGFRRGFVHHWRDVAGGRRRPRLRNSPAPIQEERSMSDLLDTPEVQNLLTKVSGLGNDKGDARLKRIVHRVVSDLFKTIEEFDIQPDEFWSAMSYLTKLGQANEVGLLVPGLGLETFLDLRMDAVERKAGIEGGTPRTIEGPLYVAGAPLSKGEARLDDGSEESEALFMDGQVRDINGRPVAGAVVDVWHANALGGYSFFDPSQPKYNLRRRIETDADGRYRFRTVLPAGYACPPQGPTRKLLDQLGRHGRRPAHIHFFVTAPGYRRLTTQINIDGDEYLHDDFAFATRQGPGGEPLAAENVAALSVRVELACSHVLDHALTQRTDSFSVAHGEFHPE